MIFADRIDAGKKLAEKLLAYKDADAVIVSLPRGGVLVGYEISLALHLLLTILIVRKLGAPHNPELGIGAIAQDGTLFLDDQAIESFGLSNEVLNSVIGKERREIARREKRYGPLKKNISLQNKIVILTDDGIATGVTVIAAILAIKKQHPRRLILAVPGCPREMVGEIEKLVDEFICLDMRENFTAVASLYQKFSQVSDEEVIELLKKKEEG
jgi:putative phosphoribosyl transferase